MKNELIHEADIDKYDKYCESIGFADIEIPKYKMLVYDLENPKYEMSTEVLYGKKITPNTYAYIEFHDAYDMDEIDWYNCHKANCIGFTMIFYLVEKSISNISEIGFFNPTIHFIKTLIRQKEKETT